MVYSPRIGPDGAFVREFSEVRKRVQSLETKPAGNMVVRQTLTTTDPVSGVSTVLGKLPDGSYGVQPFIGDTTPPPVSTVPLVSSQPGGIIVSWDGSFVGGAEKPRDFVHVNVVGHKIESGVDVMSVPVGVIRLPLDTVLVTTDMAAIDSTWQFTLVSEDYNGNVAVESSKSASVTQKSRVTDAGISSAITNLQSNIDSVSATSANGKNTVWYSTTSPATSGAVLGDTWFDTDDGNKLYEWNGSIWNPLQFGTNAIADQSIINAKIKDATIQYAKIGSVDAGTISVGEMDAVRLKAKSITADKLMITSTDNLIVEADFGNSGQSWSLGPNNSINATAGRGSLPAMRITGTTSMVSIDNLINKISVGSEDRFRGGFWMKSTDNLTPGQVELRAHAYTSATAYTNIWLASNAAVASGSYTNVSGISAALPAGTVALSFYLTATAPAASTIIDIDYVSVTRAADASLVVDGAIDGKTITGADIKTATANDIYAHMGAHSVFVDSGASPYTGIGFNKQSAPNSYDAGLYSTTGDDLVIAQGGGSQLMSYINLNHNSLDSYTYAGTTFSSRGSVNLINNGPAGRVSLQGNDVWVLNNAGIGGSLLMQSQEFVVPIQNGVPNATLWGPGMPATTAGVGTTNSNIITWSTNDTMKIGADGWYAIHWSIGFATALTGRTFLSVEPPSNGVPYARSSISAGELYGSLDVSFIYFSKDQLVCLKYWHTTGGTNNVTSTIRIRKIQ